MKEGRKQHEWMNEFGGWGGKQAKFTTERGQRKEEGRTENWKDGWKWKLAAHRRHCGEVISKRRMREYKTEHQSSYVLFFPRGSYRSWCTASMWEIATSHYENAGPCWRRKPAIVWIDVC